MVLIEVRFAEVILLTAQDLNQAFTSVLIFLCSTVLPPSELGYVIEKLVSKVTKRGVLRIQCRRYDHALLTMFSY